MTPDDFIRKWKASTLSERSAAHSHFLDLCALLGEATPTDSDQTGDSYTFEKGATKTTGGKGWADVWKRGYFAWEYKGKHKSLTAAFAQLQQYTPVLENPPLLVVSDMESIEVHTNWTATVPVVHRLSIDDLRNADTRALLKAVFSNPETLKPGRTRQALTEDVAREFAQLAMRLQGRGHDPQEVAHFVNRLVFCMFAEDVDLLPNNLFKRMLMQAVKRPEMFASMAQQLFSAMQTGGAVGFEPVMWFNGGLFDTDDALPLDKDDVRQVLAAAEQDWGQIDPSILGTLFERGLDPNKRGQLGAHYTDASTIMRLINPVIVDPLTREWEDVRRDAQAILDKAKTPVARTRGRREAERLCVSFLERLRKFRVLDPACGSGNFLYLSLVALKTLEHRANLDIEALGFTRQFPAVGPEAVQGIEINPYAAELARVSVWIGEIQWMRRNGFDVATAPILKPLDTISCRDALLAEDGSQAVWPATDAIVGNPPFLGSRRLRRVLGDAYCDRLFAAYDGQVSEDADLVCYWFAKAQAAMTVEAVTCAGLVATNSIRGGVNRRMLESIAQAGAISTAWADEPWILDGASVRVSLVCWGRKRAASPVLDGMLVSLIHADLTGDASDLTIALKLRENAGVAFQGSKKVGPFEIPGMVARQWLSLPSNPNGKCNSEVLRPSWIGIDVVRRPRDIWIIDFNGLTEAEASFFAVPFTYVKEHVKPIRDNNARDTRRTNWWLHGDAQPKMRAAIASLVRCIITPEVSKHRIFIWQSQPVLADSQLRVIAKDDYTTFGILQSRIHEVWSLRLGAWLGVGNDPRYTTSSTFETFPFPEGLTPECTSAAYADDACARCIAEAAQALVEARDHWLNPPELVVQVPEVVKGFPERVLPANNAAATTLRTRTLTALYNQRGKPEGAWLDGLHSALDEAVASAYGWPADLSDNEVLTRLLALNQARAAAQDACGN